MNLLRALPFCALPLLFSVNAAAQEPLPPPPPPPMQAEPAPPPPPTVTVQPQAQPQSQPAALMRVEPAIIDDDHAPKYSLWVGARASAMAFGFSFYENERGEAETTGNYVKNGFAPQVDIGARISYRYVPYVFYERGFMGLGHRFDNASDASAGTEFYGVGFRYVSGSVDSVGFLNDLSIGKRVIRIRNGNQTYEMSGLEFFRLGLGAEIRVKTLFALSPLLSISSGALNDSEGEVNFGCVEKGPCTDGLTKPTYTNGRVIDGSRAYVVLSLGMGIHFDLFGK